MATLLLRLAAPMQSWGDESKYDIRGTRNEPTKSGVIGMLAAAMGYRRDSSEIKEMSIKLRMGVRVDQPGVIIRDFHTAKAPKYSADGSLRYEEDGSIIMSDSYLTKRSYLCDACFLVGIECKDVDYLQSVSDALNSPVFPLYLGRRSCPPSFPINIGIKDMDLETALKQEEWIASGWFQKRGSIRARMVTETKSGQNAWYTQMDNPVDFSPIHRQYTIRGLNKEQYVVLGRQEHDPMAVL